MTWLAKINLSTVVQRLGPFRSALLLVVVIGICLFCGYRIGNFYHSYQESTIHQQKSRLDGLYQKQEEQVRRVNMLEVELAVERMANQRTQSTLIDIEKSLYEAKKDLAFYQKVMAPEKQADGLVIDSLKLLPTQSANHFAFQLALVQQRLKKVNASGYVEISLQGSLNDKPTSYKIGEVSTLTKKELSFSFKYFQIVSGEFTLPENFKPEKIIIAAVIPKGRWQKYYRLDESYDWQPTAQIDLTNAE